MHTSVLISGAGPTGLMMACQLRLMGIDCMIVDPKSGPTRESRALAVQARTLEIYEQMGIAGTAVAEAETVSALRFINPRKVITVRVFNLGKGLSAFPYFLVYEQSKNEALLYGCLKEHGGDVSWQHELVGLQQDSERVTATIRDANGQSETVTADYLIAADGARSPVRHIMGEEFSGGTYEQLFFVADTHIPGDDKQWSHETLNLYVASDSFLLLFPMKGVRRFRAVGILPKEFAEEHPESFETIAPQIVSSIRRPIQFEETSWFSVYKVHHRAASDFRFNRVFLCGDAAHVHSPAGGQGMNTGLQDAYNLAWKMAFVLQGKANANILDTYQQERHPLAERLINTTDRLFTGATSSKPFPIFFRTVVLPAVLPLLFSINGFKRFAFRTVSQIAIKYSRSRFNIQGSGTGTRLKPGMRFPYVLLQDGQSIYSLMKEMRFHLLIFSSPEKAAGIKGRFAGAFDSILDIRTISEKQGTRAAGLKEDTLVLVRPDHYVSGVVAIGKEDVLLEFLRGL